jgi:hypothetical protein
LTSHKKELQVHVPVDGQPGSAQHAPGSWSELAEHDVPFDAEPETVLQ